MLTMLLNSSSQNQTTAKHEAKVEPLREPSDLFDIRWQALLDRSALANFLGISQKTLERRLREEKWDKAESYQLGLLLSLQQQATEVFGDVQRAALWLESPVPALNNQAPIDLLDTITGFERARNTLLRQAYGMY